MLALLLVMQMSPFVQENPSLDFHLTQVAAGIVRQAGLRQYVVVSVPRSWRGDRVVQATSEIDETLIDIKISPILVEEMDDEALYAVLGHEIAHALNTCIASKLSESERILCEHNTDVLGARWTGRRASVRGLCQLIAIGWDWRVITDPSDIIERIRLLHGRSDIPWTPVP